MFFFTLQLSFSFLLNFKKKSRERNIFFLSFFTVLIQHKKDLFHLSARRGKKMPLVLQTKELFKRSLERAEEEERRKSFSIIFTWMKFYLLLWVRTKVIAGISSFREWAMIKFLNSLDLWRMKQIYILFFVILIEKNVLFISSITIHIF